MTFINVFSTILHFEDYSFFLRFPFWLASVHNPAQKTHCRKAGISIKHHLAQWRGAEPWGCRSPMERSWRVAALQTTSPRRPESKCMFVLYLKEGGRDSWSFCHARKRRPCRRWVGRVTTWDLEAVGCISPSVGPGARTLQGSWALLPPPCTDSSGSPQGVNISALYS